MKVLVTGSRDWTDVDAIVSAFSQLQPTLVIHGGNPNGADAIADGVARAQGIARCIFPANWARGNSAGPIRNRLMFDTTQPDIVLGFPLPQSRGTVDMLAYARTRSGCRVLEWGVDITMTEPRIRRP